MKYYSKKKITEIDPTNGKEIEIKVYTPNTFVNLRTLYYKFLKDNIEDSEIEYTIDNAFNVNNEHYQGLNQYEKEQLFDSENSINIHDNFCTYYENYLIQRCKDANVRFDIHIFFYVVLYLIRIIDNLCYFLKTVPTCFKSKLVKLS